MKPDYKNWVPKGMVIGFIGGASLLFAAMMLFAVTDMVVNGILRWLLTGVLSIAFIICTVWSIWSIQAYNAFSYNGKRQLSKQIIEGIADYVSVPEGGKVLDVGCGSGALAICCAKKNPGGIVVGLDRWGKEYSSFSKTLCEDNTKAEGVRNTRFINGNAIKLDFSDGSFDDVTRDLFPPHSRPAVHAVL